MFGQKSSLNKHAATVHERKKQFKCDLCNAQFITKQSMKVHISTVHEGTKQFKCDICNAMFGHKSNLNTHVAALQQSIKERRYSNDVICNTAHEGKKQL